MTADESDADGVSAGGVAVCGRGMGCCVPVGPKDDVRGGGPTGATGLGEWAAERDGGVWVCSSNAGIGGSARPSACMFGVDAVEDTPFVDSCRRASGGRNGEDTIAEELLTCVLAGRRGEDGADGRAEGGRTCRNVDDFRGDTIGLSESAGESVDGPAMGDSCATALPLAFGDEIWEGGADGDEGGDAACDGGVEAGGGEGAGGDAAVNCGSNGDTG